MPQPVPIEGKSWSTAAAYIYEKCPACVAGIGLVAVAWTQVEEGLFSLISNSLGPANKGDDGSWGLTTNWVIKASLVEAETVRVRLKIAEKTYGALINDTNEIKIRWNTISKKLTDRSVERNGVVHATYGWSESYPDGLLRIDKSYRISLWKEKDFHDVANRMQALCADLHQQLLLTLEAVHSGEVDNVIATRLRQGQFS